MSEPLAFDQIIRALPIGKPPAPTHHEPWPDHALLTVIRTTRPGGGALTYAAATLIGGKHEPVWCVSGRGVLASEARRFFGRGLGIPVLELEEFYEDAVYRCAYKPPLRAALVSWSIPSFASAGAWTVDPRGDAFRFTWWTYVDAHGQRRPDLYRSRLRVTPSSGGRATVGFDSRRDPDPEDWVTEPDGRRHQYRGRFLSLSTLGYEQTGGDQLTFSQALTLWGIERPRGDGPDALLDELRAFRELYVGMLGDLNRWPNAIPDAGASPAYLAKLVAQHAIPQPPLLRPGISLRAMAVAQAAHVGGRSEVMIRG
jgi:hypothetical protein